jgi:YMGG-like Gly-zipper
MKNLFLYASFLTLLLTSCKNTNEQASTLADQKQKVVDSMNLVMEKQKIIDSMNQEVAKAEKEKGAVIGAGVGAATGAIVSKKKGEGAIIGGLVGAGVGAGTGAIIDDKKK